MRRLQGVVVSDKMQNTLLVRVDRSKQHPKYQKYYRSSKRFKAHADTGEYKVGDIVLIQETSPLSKEKRWRVAQLVKRPQAEESLPEDA